MTIRTNTPDYIVRRWEKNRNCRVPAGCNDTRSDLAKTKPSSIPNEPFQIPLSHLMKD